MPSRARQSALEGSCRGHRGADDIPGTRGLHYAKLVCVQDCAWKGGADLELCRRARLAYGRPEVMNEKDWLQRHVGELTAQQERNEAKPWLLSDAPATYIDVMLRGIVGFRFPVTRLEGKWKMSQNRDMNDRDGVVKGLGGRGKGDDLEMAEIIMRSPTAGTLWVYESPLRGI